MRLENSAHRLWLVVMEITGIEIGYHTSLNYHLSRRITGRLQKHRIHITVWLQPGILGLHSLGAPDFSRVAGYCTVERHILRLERSHCISAPLKNTT